MNKTMTAMMKPIPVSVSNRADLRRRQEEHVLAWLQTYPNSVTRNTVQRYCQNIPGVSDDQAPNWARNSYHQARRCSAILQRLERKGHVVSVLCGDGYRYYSVPVEGGAN